jgi:uncharacterized protein YbaR (Trm112 family)
VTRPRTGPGPAVAPGPSRLPTTVPEAPSANGIDRNLLEALVCPVTRGRLAWDPERQELVSNGAGLAFPVVNGVPVMLVDEARPLDA